MKKFIQQQANKDNFYKFFKFILGGLMGYAINLTITFTLADVFLWHYIIAYSLGLGASILFNFIFALRVIFKINSHRFRIFVSYLSVVLLFFIMNLGTVKFLTESFQLNYKLVIIVVTGFFLALKYLIYDNFIFRDNNKS
ncbi:MAG TPA: GtrA family protein [bacterium]|nr:GtrA family protein [bacterium]HNS33679.1 GtrA family protein [bacterium]HOH67524.1 GtrA family protein [bacterium]